MAVFMFAPGHLGAASERRRLPGCRPFVPVVREPAEVASLHLTVPLQLSCLPVQAAPGSVVLQSDLILCLCHRGSCSLLKEIHAEPGRSRL